MRPLRKELGVSVTIVAVIFLLLACAFAQSKPSLQVTVLTKRGHPVRGVNLTLAAEDRIRLGVTNAKGEFEFANLPNLTYVLEASYLDFPVATIQDMRLQDPSSRSLLITLDPPGGYFARGLGSKAPCLLLGGADRVSYEDRQGKSSVVGTVQVLDTHNGISIGPAVTIAALRLSQPDTAVAEAQTNDRGEFHFDDLEPGRYRLKVSHKGSYTGTTMEFWVARQNTTQFGSIMMYPEGTTDLCGTVLETIPFDDPVNRGPEPELIDPNPKP
jgi:hypothetical protein